MNYPDYADMDLGPDFAADRKAVAQWAAGILADPAGVCILDSETTGLTSTDQVVELAVITVGGDVLFNERFRPTCPISPGAQAVHGIGPTDLAEAPRFSDRYAALCDALANRLIVVYNADYDRKILAATCDAFGLQLPPCRGWTCLMEQYAAWYGDWSEYHGSYRWKKLEDASWEWAQGTPADHTALGDARAALAVLKKMAADAALQPATEATE